MVQRYVRSNISGNALMSPYIVGHWRMVGARVGEPTEVATAQSCRFTGMSSLTGEVSGVIGYTWSNTPLQ